MHSERHNIAQLNLTSIITINTAIQLSQFYLEHLSPSVNLSTRTKNNALIFIFLLKGKLFVERTFVNRRRDPAMKEDYETPVKHALLTAYGTPTDTFIASIADRDQCVTPRVAPC